MTKPAEPAVTRRAVKVAAQISAVESKSDFEVIEGKRGDRFFTAALGLVGVPSAVTHLRAVRLDQNQERLPRHSLLRLRQKHLAP